MVGQSVANDVLTCQSSDCLSLDDDADDDDDDDARW